MLPGLESGVVIDSTLGRMAIAAGALAGPMMNLFRPRDCRMFVLPLVPVLGCWACLIPLIAADELAVPGVFRSELSDPEHPVHQAFQGNDSISGH